MPRQATEAAHRLEMNVFFVEKERGQMDDLRGAVTVVVERERRVST